MHERKQRALAILHQVDQVFDGWTCDASTDCCRFAVTGREPWVTQIEWQLVVAETARQGRRLPALTDDDDDERCPFLAPVDGKARHEGGRCTVYAQRPLGCRTFFCERARQGDDVTPSTPPSSSTREMREAARSLDALKDLGGPSGDDGKARPLRSWLRAALASKVSARSFRRR